MTLALLALAWSTPLDSGPLEAISAGDEAWWNGDRKGALRRWREALGSADDSPRGRAAEAMARLRLLQLTGNLAPFVHERKLYAALRACPDTEPWCEIALADAELFMPAFTGADPSRVQGLLRDSPLSGPAAARIAVASGHLEAVGARAVDTLDGMGRGILTTGRRTPPSPGTWTLGLGLGGAAGAGVGVQARFVHPDLGWAGHRLEVLGAADTRGGFNVTGNVRTATRAPLLFGAAGGRSVGDLWVDDEPLQWTLAYARVQAAIAPRWGGVGGVLGVTGRLESSEPLATVAGPYVALTLGEGDVLRLFVDSQFGSYMHVSVGADWRAGQPLAGGSLALHAGFTHVPTDSPFWRLPAVGGADVLRGLPAGRFRAHTIGIGQAEYRHVLYGPLFGAAFVDGAWADGGHLTAGVGLRIVLPPDRDNITRLDVGFGAEGWGVVAAWGEAF